MSSLSKKDIGIPFLSSRTEHSSPEPCQIALKHFETCSDFTRSVRDALHVACEGASLYPRSLSKGERAFRMFNCLDYDLKEFNRDDRRARCDSRDS